jgi:deoxyribonuclease V
MPSKPLHSWSLEPRQATALQKKLAQSVDASGEALDVRLIGGADISVPRGSKIARAAIVVLSYPEMEIVEAASYESELAFPYIPGLLSFREAPLIIELFGRLSNRPGLLVVDGQGVAHPRRIGLASHLGLWLDIPTIGCAKSRLCGEHAEVGAEAGSAAELLHEEEVIGTVLRSRKGTKPLYISAGHKICLENAVWWVKECLRGYRLPEPTRLAHLAAGGNLPQNHKIRLPVLQ